MPAKPSLNSKRILYVEDNADTGEMVRYLLAASKYEVIVSDTVKEALEKARDQGFGFYIIDHALPDGHGMDLCKEIRKFDAKTPIIFCSGFADDEHRKDALDSGAQAFLAKPFDVTDLLNLIMRLATN